MFLTNISFSVRRLEKTSGKEAYAAAHLTDQAGFIEPSLDLSEFLGVPSGEAFSLTVEGAPDIQIGDLLTDSEGREFRVKLEKKHRGAEFSGGALPDLAEFALVLSRQQQNAQF